MRISLRLLFLIYCFSFFSPQIHSQTNTSEGTEFWIAFPNDYYALDRNQKLFISSIYNTTGTLSSVVPGVNQTFSVTPGLVTEITLPHEVVSNSGIENKGIKITTVNPVSVYVLDIMTATSDAYLALPTNSLGQNYRIISYPTIFSYTSNFLVLATTNGTNVNIHNHLTGITDNIVLNLGQTYTVAGSNNGDLTGSTITSDKPIAVFGSSSGSNVPVECETADYIVEMIFPKNSWGKNFITIPTAGRDGSGDIFRIVAGHNNTNIYINGAFVTNINDEDFYEINLTGQNHIETSEPSLIVQYAKGVICTGNITGDPFMMQIVPNEQFLTNYTISTVIGFTSNWANIVCSANGTNSTILDGIQIPQSSFSLIPGTNLYGAQIQISNGSHTFTSSYTFGLYVYGWNMADSYGYPGGCSMSPVATVANITLTPDTLYGLLNTSNLCYTATVTNNLNAPVENILVDFHARGLNPVDGFGYTDANGQTTFCYTQTGTNTGTDTIKAVVGTLSSVASYAIWTNCSNPSSGGVIGNAQSGCGFLVPAQLVNITSPTGGQGTTEYKWQFSITGSSSGFVDIASSDNESYSPGLLSQTSWYRRIARVGCQPDWTGAAVSNVIEITIVPVSVASVSISASANPFCTGQQITISSTVTNEGSAPHYQWLLNGNPAGTDIPAFSFTPSDNDSVRCLLTSNKQCVANTTVSSNKIILHPDLSHPAGITISASANPFCSETTVNFTAIAVNGGASPSFQWKVNGSNTGTNSSGFSFVPLNNDLVQCVLNSNLNCVSNNPVTSEGITMVQLVSPQVSFIVCFDTVITSNAKPFTLKGGIPLGGTYSGPGVNSATGIFTPSLAGTGAKNISYTYINAGSCSGVKSKTVTIQTAPAFTCGNLFTDIRDNKSYKTIQIGTQCWMAEALNFGSAIPQTVHQRDNCVPEKYATAVPPPFGGGQEGAYQWDELMDYSTTPGSKGIFPSGWHVPDESEWQLLFSNWTNSAFAGSPLKYSGFSGFNALLHGSTFQNSPVKFAGFSTCFWTSSSHGSFKAISHPMNDKDPSVSAYPSSRQNAFPVRCVKD